MSFRVTRRREATAELRSLLTLIEEDNPDAALRFLDAFEQTCAHLAEHPEMGELFKTDHPELQGIRKKLIGPFTDYLLLYRFDGEEVDVLHLFSGKQDYERLLRRRR